MYRSPSVSVIGSRTVSSGWRLETQKTKGQRCESRTVQIYPLCYPRQIRATHWMKYKLMIIFRVCCILLKKASFLFIWPGSGTTRPGTRSPGNNWRHFFHYLFISSIEYIRKGHLKSIYALVFLGSFIAATFLVLFLLLLILLLI